MGNRALKAPKRWTPFARTTAKFVAAYLFAVFGVPPLERYVDTLHTWWWRGYDSWPEHPDVAPAGASLARIVAHRVSELFVVHAGVIVPAAALVALLVATVAVPFGAMVRRVARVRVAGKRSDPLEPARMWVAKHPHGTRALTAAPGSALAFFLAYEALLDGYGDAAFTLQYWPVFAIAAVFTSMGLAAFARSGLRALLAPTVDPEAEPVRLDVSAEEITFDAVAVTRETRGAVMAMLALTVGAMVLPLVTNPNDPRVVGALVAYAAVALGGAALFRHASKIAVGVDGVLVKGTSRTRFFAYRDLDGARADWSGLLLERKGRVVLRLQLHGEDSARKEAILARIVESIDRAKGATDARAVRLASSASTDQLTRVASGASDYRTASLTRDELWSLVEGPSVDAATRAAAAEALARTGDDSQRARLRVVAESCAEPQARVALQALVEREAGHEEERARSSAKAR